jgi:hypothetical protein
MTPEQLALLAGVILSLAFSYVPGLSTWFDGLAPDRKRLVMLAALFVVAAGSFVLSCAGYADYFACTTAGAYDAVGVFILAMIANQGTYLLTPKG